MIIIEYLAREIGRPFAVILGILCALFGGYSISSSLADPANGLLPASVIFELAGLKLLISQDVLIPVALYFAVLLSFSRMQADHEITAMEALGARPAQIARAVLGIAVVTALAVGVMAMLARPWAYRTSHDITWMGATKVDINAMQAGTFYASQDGNRVIYLNRRAGRSGLAQDVFVRRNIGGHTEVIFAQSATPLAQHDAGGQREVYFSNAHIYEIDPANPNNDQLLSAAGLKIDPAGVPGSAPGYSPVAASNRRLASSAAPRDIAELQWRLSTPVSTLLLALMGIPLSRTKSRQGRYARFGPAILIYTGYYLLCTTARTWVEHGNIGPLPGIWWAPMLLGLLLLAAFNETGIRRYLSGESGMNILDRYIGVLTLRIFILAMAALTVLFSLLDFVQQLSLVGQGSYDARDALIYTVFTAPSRVLMLAPVAMLLASLLALGLLARHAELTAWRSLGVSEARIIGALIKLSLPIIFLLFLIAQYVVPTAQQLAQRAQEAALGESATALHYGGFWVAHNQQYLNVQHFAYDRMPQDIDIFSFADDGSLADYKHADSATINPDGTWQLQNVLEKRVQGTQFVTDRLPSLAWQSFVTPQHMQLLQLPPATMPPVDLFRYIHEQKRDDQRAVSDELVFWNMVSIPLSLLALVLAGAPFAFGAQRMQSAGRQVLVGALLGIGFELTQQLVITFGARFSIAPAVAALAPSVLLGFGAAYALQRAHHVLRSG